MTLIIGSLALLVALIALWLATFSMKKIEAQGDILLQRVRSEQRKASDELNAKIAKLAKQILKITEQLKNRTEEEN